MYPVFNDSRLPLYQQLHDQLVENIANNRWHFGEAIPSEAALAIEFSLSTGTVRKAVDLLVTEGILEKQQGRGTFVRRPQFSSSLFRFFDFPSLYGEPSIPDGKILSVTIQTAPPAIVDVLNIRHDNAKAIRIFCLCSVAGMPFLHEEIWLPYSLFSPLMEVNLQHEGALLYPLYERYCGQIVASADETLTAEASDAAYSGMMQIPVGSPIVVIERVARDFTGVPLEWRRSRGKASHFSYTIQTR